jgi:hypothetical protein
MIFYTALKEIEITGDQLLDKRYARIAYENLGGTITSSGDALGYDAVNVQSQATYNKWRSDSAIGGTIELDLGSILPVDSISINSEKLAGTYTFEQWDGGAWVVIDAEADLVLTTNEPLIYNFVEVSTDKIRVTIVSLTAPEITNLYVGKAMVMERALFSGHTPVTLGRNTVSRTNMSNTAQFLGLSIVKKGVSTSYAWDNLTTDFYRDTFDSFAKVSKFPFFIAWNSDKFTNDVGYVWSGADLRPTFNGTRDWMQVSMDVAGVNYGE